MGISYYNIPNSCTMGYSWSSQGSYQPVLTWTAAWANSSLVCHHLVFLLQLRDQTALSTWRPIYGGNKCDVGDFFRGKETPWNGSRHFWKLKEKCDWL
jgi:hypothetical protein